MDTEKKNVKRTNTTPFIRIPEKARIYRSGKIVVRKVKKGQVLV